MVTIEVSVAGGEAASDGMVTIEVSAEEVDEQVEEWTPRSDGKTEEDLEDVEDVDEAGPQVTIFQEVLIFLL